MKKLTVKDKNKMQKRYDKMFDEYKLKTLEELKNIYQTSKISGTDRIALIDATRFLQNKELDGIIATKTEELKQDIKTEINEEVNKDIQKETL
jgi:hypothetical protein